MEQRVGSTAFRFVAGALFTLALLASGYLLGVTQFSPPPEPEPALAELAELEQLVAAVQSMGSSISDLTAQVAQLHVSFADLQARVAQQGTAVESLGDTVLSFSSDISAQAESALAQLQALAVDPEASELDALLQTVQSMDHSLARLAEQVAQLQDGLAGLEGLGEAVEQRTPLRHGRVDVALERAGGVGEAVGDVGAQRGPGVRRGVLRHIRPAALRTQPIQIRRP